MTSSALLEGHNMKLCKGLLKCINVYKFFKNIVVNHKFKRKDIIKEPIRNDKISLLID